MTASQARISIIGFKRVRERFLRALNFSVSLFLRERKRVRFSYYDRRRHNRERTFQNVGFVSCLPLLSHPPHPPPSQINSHDRLRQGDLGEEQAHREPDAAEHTDDPEVLLVHVVR